MFLEIIIAILLGTLAGTFTGLIPGIHTNLIAATLVTLANELTYFFSLTQLVVFIIAMSITHTFVSAIPSIYLGAPGADMVLSALPGHQLLHEGKGHIAILLTVFGGISATLMGILLAPLVLRLLPIVADNVTPYVGYVLLFLIILLLLYEKHKFLALAILILSGICGSLTFSLNLTQPLLALLSGFFGVSLLILSLKQNAIPKQITQNLHLHSEYIFASFIATIAGFFAAFLPGFGASQAAIYASLFVKNTKELFLVLTGGLNTVAMFFSLGTFFVLEKARNGSIVAVSQLTQFTFHTYILLIIVILITLALSGFLTSQLSHVFLKILKRISYVAIVISVCSFLVLLVWYFDGFLGLSILLLATVLGIATQLFEIPKHYLLGCLLLPVLTYFL